MPSLNPNAQVVSSSTSGSSALTTTNFLQPNSFKLTINRKNFPNLEFFCQTIMHPDVTTPSVQVSYKGIGDLALPADKINFGELTCMIILDEDMNSYVEMLNWMKRIVISKTISATSAGANFDSNPPSYADMTLSILSSSNNQIRKIRYIDCIPVSLGNINFESVASGDQYITYPASFKFSYFELT